MQEETSDDVKDSDLASITATNLSSFIQDIQSSDLSQRLHGVASIRNLLAQQDNHSLCKQLIDNGIIAMLLSCCQQKNNLNLQLEAVWAISLISSHSSQCLSVSETMNALKRFLTTANDPKIIKYTLATIENIATQSQKIRNCMLHNGILDAVLHKIPNDPKTSLLCLSKLLCYDGEGTNKNYQKTTEPPSDLCEWMDIKQIVPVLNDLLKTLKVNLSNNEMNEEDVEICTVCLEITHHTQCYVKFAQKSTYISDIFDSQIVNTIISFMEIENDDIISLTLGIISKFVSDGDCTVQKILKSGFLRSALLILKHCKNQNIKQKVCMILTHITQCRNDIIMQLIEYTECESIICGFLRASQVLDSYVVDNIPPIILGVVSSYWDKNGEILRELAKCCLYDDDKVKREAGVVLTNIVSFAINDPQIIHFMVRKGVIGALRAVMKTSSVRAPLIRCMKAFDIIMSHTRSREDGNEFNYIQKVEKVGCCEIFDILQAGVDDRDQVYNWSFELCQKYWPEDNQDSVYRWLPLSNHGQNILGQPIRNHNEHTYISNLVG